MGVNLSGIVKSTYCYYELHSGCVNGLEMPDTKICGNCVADAHDEIISISNMESGN